MIVESDAGAADEAVATLERAGHRIRRCHEPGADAFPCNALQGPAGCPLAGAVDVALVVRPGVRMRPTALEDGVTCAIRAGIPVVEDGPRSLDPFAPWLTARVGERGAGLEDACVRAVAQALSRISDKVTEKITPVLQREGIDLRSVTVSTERRKDVLHVSIVGPIPDSIASAVSIRAGEGVRAVGRREPVLDISILPASL